MYYGNILNLFYSTVKIQASPQEISFVFYFYYIYISDFQTLSL